MVGIEIIKFCYCNVKGVTDDVKMNKDGCVLMELRIKVGSRLEFVKFCCKRLFI